MSLLLQMVKRNLRLYLRDRATVFFSFLSVIIILALYILFLGDMQVGFLESSPENGGFGLTEHVEWVVASWIMAGILMVSTVTVPLSAVGKLIDDREKGMLNDFFVSPINRNLLVLSYLISAWVIGGVMVFFNFLIGQVYVLSQGGSLLPLWSYVQLFGLVTLSIMTFSTIFFYLSLHIKTSNAWGTLGTLVGTFIGFLGGIYIPIGALAKGVQNVMNVLPTSHAVTLVRRIYMSTAIDATFEGQEAWKLSNYSHVYGLDIYLGDFEMQGWHMLLSMVVFLLGFYLLSILKIRRTKL